MKKLLENALIITIDEKRHIYDKGYILINDKTIEEVKPGQYTGNRENIECIDMSNKAILPGFVNAHSHMAGSLFKGLLEDDPNSFSMYALPMELNLTGEDVYYLTLAGSYESMASGITCANEIYHYGKYVAKAIDEIGLRAVISENIVDVNIGRIGLGDYSRDEAKGLKLLNDNIELIKNYHGKDDGRILCRVGPHATDTVSLDLAKKCNEVAKQYGVGIHTHCAQLKREYDVTMKEYGLTPVQFLKQAGYLNSNTVAAHCIYVDDNDIDLLAASGIHLAHCTRSYATGNEFAPMAKIFEKGVDVVLATDWVSQDPWANMMHAVGINRHRDVPLEYTTAESLLERFTIGSAKALGLDNVIGSLEKGKQADLQVIDLRSPHLMPMYNHPITTLVYNGCKGDVSDVMIAGNFTIRNKQLQTTSAANILDNVQKVGNKLYAFGQK